MVINLNDIVPLVTIIGAAVAPTAAAFWASRVAIRKLDEIHVLVNNQLTQAVERLAAAETQIAELKELVRSMSGRK